MAKKSRQIPSVINDKSRALQKAIDGVKAQLVRLNIELRATRLPNGVLVPPCNDAACKCAAQPDGDIYKAIVTVEWCGPDNGDVTDPFNWTMSLDVQGNPHAKKKRELQIVFTLAQESAKAGWEFLPYNAANAEGPIKIEERAHDTGNPWNQKPSEFTHVLGDFAHWKNNRLFVCDKNKTWGSFSYDLYVINKVNKTYPCVNWDPIIENEDDH